MEKAKIPAENDIDRREITKLLAEAYKLGVTNGARSERVRVLGSTFRNLRFGDEFT